MKVIRVYIENSVIGGYFDEEFEEPTRRLFEMFRKGIFRPVISAHVIDELNDGAPQYVKDILESIEYERFEVTDEMEMLADEYIQRKCISENYRDDALHIAVATIIGVNLLVSWNFKHIVNYRRIRLFNAVNLTEGYPALDIRTPREVIEDE